MSFNSKKNFFLLTFGQFISVIGDRISTVVFFSLVIAIVGSSQSTYQSSLLVALQVVPFLFFGYFFGFLADIVEKRKILIFADITRAIIILSLFFFHQSLTYIYICVFLIGLLTSMFEPARKSILPFLVENKNLIFYNKLYATLEILAIMIGLMVGTFLLQFISIQKALILDVITYLFSLLLIFFIKYKDESEVLEKRDKFKKLKEKYSTYKKDLKLGIKYLKNHNNVKFVIINIIFFHFLASAIYFTVINDFSIRNSHLTPFNPEALISLSLLVIAFGGLLSPLIKYFLKNVKESKLTIYIYILGSILILIQFFILTFLENYFYPFLITLFFLGNIAGLNFIRYLYLIHINCEKVYMGRVVSVSEIVWSLVIVVGILFGSYFNQVFTYQYGILLVSFIYFLGALSFIYSSKKISW